MNTTQSDQTKFGKCACPFCEGRIEYPLAAAGTQINCPHCAERFQLPSITLKDKVQAAPCPHCQKFIPVDVPACLFCGKKLPAQKRQSQLSLSPATKWVLFFAGLSLLIGMGFGLSTDKGIMPGLFLSVIFFISLGLYFLPVITAMERKNRNVTAIGLINFFFGWTVLGWFGALIWAVYRDKQ